MKCILFQNTEIENLYTMIIILFLFVEISFNSLRYLLNIYLNSINTRFLYFYYSFIDINNIFFFKILLNNGLYAFLQMKLINQ